MKNIKPISEINEYSSFSVRDVSLTEDYLTNAFGLEVEYLLSMDCDKWLAGFRETVGLDMKGKTRYGGWESMLIAGHAFGHYLGACSYAAISPDITEEERKQFENKITYIIDELKLCQDAYTGNKGFLWCAPTPAGKSPEIQFDYVEEGKTDIIKEAWVPWYTMHKILQGIIDVYANTGYEPALSVAKGIGDWTYNRSMGWSEELRLKVLSTEYGGMNDCLYDLYHLTGEDKYAIAAHRFDEEALFERVLSGEKDALNNIHANTTIPKFVGAMKRYTVLHGKTVQGETVDASKYLAYSKAFFEMVRDNHTYITGGNSEWEHFGKDKILDAERTNCNNETCNTYNMLKLAKLLFMKTGDKQYADFYENTYINAILSSQNPKTGMTMYFQPMATGYFKTYSERYTKFWCCTGTGMENFTTLGNAIYFEAGNAVTVNMYLGSALNTALYTLTQESEVLKGGNAVFTISDVKGGSAEGELRFRIPDWCDGEASVKLNGEKIEFEEIQGYACVSASLKNGDRFEVELPMKLKAHPLPDNDSSIALKYGPVLLSARLGRENMKTVTTGVDVTIPEEKIVESEALSLPAGITKDQFLANPGHCFTQNGLSFIFNGTELEFTPHYSKYDERYGIYFYYVTE